MNGSWMKKFSASVFWIRNGSTKAVVTSGSSIMSDSWMAWNPRIDDPSKARPSVTTLSSNDSTGMLKCCITPGRSQNRTSTNLTSSSLRYRRSSSGLANTRPPGTGFSNRGGVSRRVARLVATLWARSCPGVSLLFPPCYGAGEAATRGASARHATNAEAIPGTRRSLVARSRMNDTPAGVRPDRALPGRLRPPVRRAADRLGAVPGGRRASTPTRGWSPGRRWSVLIVLNTIFIGLFGQTPGMALAGIRCISDRRRRRDRPRQRRCSAAVLLALLIPAVIMDDVPPRPGTTAPPARSWSSNPALSAGAAGGTGPSTGACSSGSRPSASAAGPSARRAACPAR